MFCVSVLTAFFVQLCTRASGSWARSSRRSYGDPRVFAFLGLADPGPSSLCRCKVDLASSNSFCMIALLTASPQLHKKNSLAGFLLGAFVRSGRQRGPGKSFQEGGGRSPHILEGSPGPPGPARPQTCTPQIRPDCLQVPSFIEAWGAKAPKSHIFEDESSFWPWYPRPPKNHLSKKPLRNPFQLFHSDPGVVLKRSGFVGPGPPGV